MTGEGSEVADDPGIPNNVVLLRSFSSEFVAAVHGAADVRPDRRAFQEITIAGVRAMSVYRADVLDSMGLQYEMIIEAHPDHLIVSLPAWKFRELDLGIVPAPEAGLVGPAHCHVFGKLTKGRQNRLVQAVVDGIGSWVKRP